MRHGYSKHQLYRVWANMKRRIYNKNHPNYKDYGGRGITICDEWIHHPINFIGWALNNGYKKGLHLDRINNDGDYKPNNCRFITQSDSKRNTQLLKSTNTSGYRGAAYHKLAGKWQSNIMINRKRKHLGLFESKRLAALRYDAEAYRLNDGRPMNFMINHVR